MIDPFKGVTIMSDIIVVFLILLFCGHAESMKRQPNTQHKQKQNNREIFLSSIASLQEWTATSDGTSHNAIRPARTDLLGTLVDQQMGESKAPTRRLVLHV